MTCLVLVVEGVDINCYALDARPCTLGRSRDCDIVIADPAVSARHALIESIYLGHVRVYFIRDLASTNGTWIGRRRVSRVRLMDQDLITIGANQFRFESADQGAARGAPQTSGGELLEKA